MMAGLPSHTCKGLLTWRRFFIAALTLLRLRWRFPPLHAIGFVSGLSSLKPPRNAAWLGCRAAGDAPRTRSELKEAVFSHFDVDRDARLTSAELRNFACSTGFDGDAADWLDEYGYICDCMGCQAGEGLSEEVFSRLVDDESEDGCYCSDAELAAMLQAPATTATGTKPTPKSPASVTVDQASHFAAERKQGAYEKEWKAWEAGEGFNARSPRIASVPGFEGCPSTASAQEAVMFLHDQLESGKFRSGNEDRIGRLMERSSSAAAGWFAFDFEETALDEAELSELVLAPEGWTVERGSMPEGYMQHIVTVGHGLQATMGGGTHISSALHRDVSKCKRLCDTCLIGVVGRKRALLFAPDEFKVDSTWARSPDFSEHPLRFIKQLPDDEAWAKMEEYASRDDVIGGVLDLEPGMCVFVPHGWWHAVKPVDGFTFITGPSRLSPIAVQDAS
eukprot:TRINITY_DN63285_c0_g1_i1.p1 TRINITY_DN63285_c0_g1~~TRINITY_DN63285_c0_g1_i1.p1  ORF type:complete len:448 (-),score=98.63 TRINITY_DN63285_c0_g1_i1:58-1401(-)